MGIGVSIFLIALGAILTWGVTAEPEGLNLDAVGVILMLVGLLGLVLSMLFWRTWGGPAFFRRTTYVDDGRGYGYRPDRPRRTTYVEEEDVPAAPAPPGEPPPPAGPPPPP